MLHGEWCHHTDEAWEVLESQEATEDLRNRLFRHEPRLKVIENEAIKWWMLAARRGLADAQFELASAFDGGRRGGLSGCDYLPLNPGDVIEWLCRAVAQGHKKAVAYLLNPHQSLTVYLFMKPPLPLVVDALEHAVENGNAEAAFFLAKLCSWGDMLMRDCAKASQWLREAARLGHEETIRMVLNGVHNFPGKELEPDGFSAKASLGSCWDKRGWGHLGEAKPQFSHAEDLGRRSSKPVTEAAWWYQAAAEQGHPEAIKRVAELGDAVTKAIIDMLRPFDQRPQSPKTP